MSAKATHDDSETRKVTTVHEVSRQLESGFRAAERAVERAGRLDQASRQGERDAYQHVLGVVENYEDLEWAKQVCLDQEARYRRQSIDAEEWSPAMTRKFRAQFRAFGQIAARLDQVINGGGA